MQRAFTALRCSLGILLLGAVLGAGVGLVRGIQLAAQNDYQAQGLARLGRWTLVQAASQGMRQGVVVALVILAFLIVLWPIARLFLGDWRRALHGAALAIPVIGLWLPSPGP